LVQRKQPEAVHAEPLEIVQFADKSADVSGSVSVGIGEAPDQHLVEDGPLVPVRVVRLLTREGVRDWLRCRAHLSDSPLCLGRSPVPAAGGWPPGAVWACGVASLPTAGSASPRAP